MSTGFIVFTALLQVQKLGYTWSGNGRVIGVLCSSPAERSIWIPVALQMSWEACCAICDPGRNSLTRFPDGSHGFFLNRS